MWNVIQMTSCLIWWPTYWPPIQLIIECSPAMNYNMEQYSSFVDRISADSPDSRPYTASEQLVHRRTCYLLWHAEVGRWYMKWPPLWSPDRVRDAICPRLLCHSVLTGRCTCERVWVDMGKWKYRVVFCWQYWMWPFLENICLSIVPRKQTSRVTAGQIIRQTDRTVNIRW